MKKPIHILFLVLLVGCSGPIKSSWDNFRAHYNTHYNAKKSFRAGLKQVESQPVTLNPEQPIRAHRVPNGAGNQQFSTAIEKEARLLREFPETKWVEEAVFLIGKSYYYRQEYYLAVQKFEELYALDPAPRLKQLAVIWKGRTLLDMEQHLEAISYLENELKMLDGPWYPESRAEVGVLLGQLYTQVSNWESAAAYLGTSMKAITDRPFLGRVYFLYGQVLERLGRYGEAYFAYDQVSSHFPDYEYIYWAEVRKGEVARQEGNLDLALNIFQAMKNDDKNYQRQKELDYEIARTRELMGDTKVAEQLYNRLLHTGTMLPPREIQAKVYYRLGQIYSEKYQNYEIAAAYYDSSSIQAVNPALGNGKQDAGVLASALDRYTFLKNAITRADSLLHLGSLQPAELDSVIESVREQKRLELQQQHQDEADLSGRVMTNVQQVETDRQDAEAFQYGFLNYRNQNLLADSKNKFQAVWGKRPLVDNWRRLEVVANGLFREGQSRSDQKVQGMDGTSDSGLLDTQMNIDISEIPVAESDRIEMRRRKATAQYELGSLFFLTLDLPDSAAYYFTKVIREQPQGELEAKSMYSLFDLYHSLEQEDSSRVWGRRVLNEYPNTVYSRKVRQRMNDGQTVQATTDTTDRLLAKVQEVEQASDSLSLVERAEAFRSLALENRTSEAAPYIHYRAVEDYVRFAREQTDSTRYAQFWKTYTRGEKAEDSTHAGVHRDSTVIYESLFNGAHWDSVRTVIEEHDTTFAEVPQNRRLRVLDNILKTYSHDYEAVTTCSDPGVTPQMRRDMDDFLDQITLPDSVRETDLPAQIIYRMVISNDGTVMSYQLMSDKEITEIAEVYEQAIGEYLQFIPLSSQTDATEVQCTVSFPVRR